jgi:flagellar biosynthesis/type III secretory pathway protein FliH
MNKATDLLAQMIESKRALESLPPVQSEMRMHPADIEALRRQCGATKATGPINSWSGIKIIPDESAERLPRKPA